MELTEVAENVYGIERSGDMRVPARIYGSAALVEGMRENGDRTLDQLCHVAALPGIRRFAVLLPDGHQGYGFPVGGVAAVDRTEGVVTPGGIGFDVNCGVRVLRSDLRIDDVRDDAEDLADRLDEAVPTGTGKGAIVDADLGDVREILDRGMEWSLDRGDATTADLTHCEENGRLPGDSKAVPAEALKRGVNQVGSLGSGNHFLEVGYVTDVHDDATAEAFGLEAGQVVVTIHTGSRGLGHGTCTHYVREFESAYSDLVDALPDRQLAYAPLGDRLAERYLSGMNAAANYAWVNRQAITAAVREVFAEQFGDPNLELVYDVCHNVAKEERHVVDGRETVLLVHRKGATRAFPAGHSDIPDAYRDVGQPVFVPGSMGTHSYVLVGGPSAMDRTFGSTVHGAGRALSRTRAKARFRAGELRQSLRDRGIFVRARSGGTLAEEAPAAYKDVDEVVRVSDALGLGTRVARVAPLANVKG
jgi:tRNA-splicing ligase RtcB